MIHKRTYRIESLDDTFFAKTIIVDVGLDRMKEWELVIKDFNIKVNDNKINSAKKEIKHQLRQLHLDYLEGILEEPLKSIYAEYIKPYYCRARTPQAENVKKLREENRKLKQKL